MRLRQSLAKLIIQECPAVARLALDGLRTAGGPAVRRGSLVDQLVFGGSRYEVVSEAYSSGPRKGQPADDWSGTAARKKRDEIEARGWTPCLPAELEQAQELAGRIRAELILAGLDLTAENVITQRELEWTTPMGTEAAGIPDAIVLAGGHAHTFDLKVGESANPAKLDVQVDAMCWDMQGAVYQEAARATMDRDGQHWLIRACPKTKIVGVYPLSPSYLRLGQDKWEHAQRVWQRCIERDEWPQYPHRPLEPPPWLLRRFAERGLGD